MCIRDRLIGKPVPASFSLFPPFYSECGKNIFIAEHVFINCGCHFQDHGGIYIDEGTQIGSYVVIATINHGQKPSERSNSYPAPIHIGKNVWIGSHAAILPGVTINEMCIRDRDSNMETTILMTDIVQDVVQIIKFQFNMNLDEHSLNYSRLITHLRYFTLRMLHGELAVNHEDLLFNTLKNSYHRAYECALKIKDYFYKRCNITLTNEELSYLIIHINLSLIHIFHTIRQSSDMQHEV